MNLVRGRLEPGDGERMVFEGDGGMRFHAGLVSSVPGASLPARVVAGFRPEHVLLSAAAASGSGTGIAANVVLVEQLGREYIVHMEAGGQKLAAVATAGDPPEQGETVTVVPDPARLYFFDSESGERLG